MRIPRNAILLPLLLAGAGCPDPTPPHDSADVGSTDAGGRSALAMKLQTVSIVPPAGVKINFSVLNQDGHSPGPLGASDFSFTNDLTGKPFDTEGGGEPFVGTPSDAFLYTVIALDLSGSIFAHRSQDAVLAAAKQLIHSLIGQGHRVAVYAFGSATAELSQWIISGPNPLDSPSSTNEATLDNALDTAFAFGSRGGTALYAAYKTVLQEARRPTPDAGIVNRSVVVLSDGNETANPNGLSDALFALHNGPAVNVYVLGIKGDVEESVLKQLVSDSKNYFSTSATEADLVASFAKIDDDIRALTHTNWVTGICSPVDVSGASVTVAIDAGTSYGTLKVPYSTNRDAGWTGDVSRCGPLAVASPSTVVVPSASVPAVIRATAATSSGLFIVTTDNRVFTAPLDGGQSPTQLLPAVGPIGAITVTGDQFYWIGNPSMPNGTLNTVLPDGGVSTILNGLSNVDSIAVRNDTLFWTSVGDVVSGSGGAVLRAPLDGGLAQPIAPNEPRAAWIAATSGEVFWATLPSFNADAGMLNHDGSLKVLRPDGGIETLVANTDARFVTSTSDDAVYWVQFGPPDTSGLPNVRGELKLLAPGSNNPVTVATGAFFVAADTTDIYWQDFRWNPQTGSLDSEGLVWRLHAKQGPVWLTAQDGGTAEIVAMHETFASPLVVGPTRVYWLPSSPRPSIRAVERTVGQSQ